uniref:Uncharacterized protein n=1 Tax=Anguilla anguilla TaxID=7936 RepID=A0A0E9W940_ANGAN
MEVQSDRQDRHSLLITGSGGARHLSQVL